MNITFKNIDETNIDNVKKLKIREDQQKFIESIEDCLQEASLVKQWHPVAIYNDNILVGFAMYGSFNQNKHTWIDRILIDEKYQGKGYGKSAMIRLIEIVSKEYNVKTIYLSIIKENDYAAKLYKSIGFEDMNEIDPSNGELIFKYTLKQ